MRKLSNLRFVRWLGVAAALCVPAAVVAQLQQRPPPAEGTFAPNQVLRASQIDGLRDALADAIARIDQLQNRPAQSPAAVPRAYTTLPTTAPIEPGGVVDRHISGACSEGDIAMSCNCDGSVAAIQIERFVLSPATRTCNCSYFNSNPSVRQTVSTSVNCLDVTP
jgi:hypothetical protein